MTTIECGTCVEVTVPAPPVVAVTLPGVDVSVSVPMTGPPGPPGSDADVTAHIADPRPHAAAESGKDFAGWYTALTT